MKKSKEDILQGTKIMFVHGVSFNFTYCTEPHPDYMMQVRIVIVEESKRNNTPLTGKSFNVCVEIIETLKIE